MYRCSSYIHNRYVLLLSLRCGMKDSVHNGSVVLTSPSMLRFSRKNSFDVVSRPVVYYKRCWFPLQGLGVETLVKGVHQCRTPARPGACALPDIGRWRRQAATLLREDHQVQVNTLYIR